MHDIKTIRDNPQAFDAGLARRGLEPRAAELIALDDARRAAIAELQKAQERRNAASKEIGQAMARKDAAAAEALKAEVATLKTTMPEMEARGEGGARGAGDASLPRSPTCRRMTRPNGRDENDNVEIRRIGAPPHFPNSYKPREHFEIGEALGLMDFEAAAKMSGARFVVLKGALARLERALMQFMLDLHTGEHGYEEVAPPLLVRDDAMFGTAQLPKFREDQFSAQNAGRGTPRRGLEAKAAVMKLISQRRYYSDTLVRQALDEAASREQFWLIPTAEVPLTNLVRESIVDEKRLPLRYTAGTPCFRAEAGAAGRDTRGMIRMHQFNKVELVSITTPEQSAAEHQRMTALRRGSAETPRPAFPHHGALHRRHGLCARRRPMTSKSGCRGRGAFARFRPVRSAAISRRGA